MGADVPKEPPDEAYGRVTNPERFQPLHRAALELIARLATDYEVDRADGTDLDPEAARLWPGSRSTRLIPADGAPLTFTFTPFPGISLRFGYHGRDTFPPCGCDACNEDPTEEARRMTEVASDVVAGGLSETRRRRVFRSDTYESRLIRRDGGVWGRSGPAPTDPDPDPVDKMPLGTTDWSAWGAVP